ncbi:tryptophan 7-halogenase [Actinophytocola sp.]|uniref:tryptophan 7-halogenase n=1 Tax=Actinophytocola sp. TaxID=1872138 RepID=UPI003D6C0CEA
MPETEEFDLIVIGGGPAGATVSTLVAMQGLSVLLLERESFPRYQIGESLLPITVHGICGMLGCLDELKSANFVKKLGGVFRWGRSPEPWRFNFAIAPELEKVNAGYAFQVERSRFDEILLNNARKRGVQVRENHSVKKLIVEDGRLVGVRFADGSGAESTARARFVADASGNQSQFHKLAGERVVSEFFQNIALFTYFENAKRLPEPFGGNILCAAFDAGWFWYIPLSDTLTSVGAVVDRRHAAKIQQGQDAAMRGFIDSCDIVKDLLAPATRVTEGQYGKYRVRRDYSYSNTRYWMPGLILLGDAACFIDPVFSTGVHLATYSGLLAARSINSLLKGTGDLDEDRAFTEFETRYRSEFENIYKFLIAFYDFNRHEDSYFWEARKILNTTERDNEAFVRLIAGVSTTDPEIFATGQRISDHLRSFDEGADDEGILKANKLVDVDMKGLQDQVLYGDERPAEKPRFDGGLVPTTDGFFWTTTA